MAGHPAVLGGLILAALAAAEPPPAPAPEEPPDAELLLFLAEFGDEQGRFVDPTTIDAKPARERDAADEDDEQADDDAPKDPPL